MRIDCTRCEMYRSEHCRDCLVTALLSPPGAEIDEDLDAPLRTLQDAGLVPALRYRPRRGAPGAARAG